MSFDKEKRGATRLGDVLGNMGPLKWIRAWKRSAGPVLLKQSQFLGIKEVDGKRSLLIQVSDPLWRGELEYQRFDLLNRFNQELTKEGVPQEQHPEVCLLTANASMPFQTGYAQQGRNKVRVKR